MKYVDKNLVTLFLNKDWTWTLFGDDNLLKKMKIIVRNSVEFFLSSKRGVLKGFFNLPQCMRRVSATHSWFDKIAMKIAGLSIVIGFTDIVLEIVSSRKWVESFTSLSRWHFMKCLRWKCRIRFSRSGTRYVRMSEKLFTD